MALGSGLPASAPSTAEVRGLRVVVDARLKDGVSGGVQQWVIGLATALLALDDGPEEYLFLTLEGEDGWLRPYVAGRGRIVSMGAGTPSPATSTPAGSTAIAEPLPATPRSGTKRPALIRSLVRRLRRLLGRVPPRSPAGRTAAPSPAPSPRAPAAPRPPAPRAPSAGHVAIAAEGADVMHFTSQSGFRTSVSTIFQPWDLQHVHLPDFFTPEQRAGRDRRYRAWCGQAARVVVATTWVKDDLTIQYGIEPERIVVVNPPPATLAYVPPTAEEEAEIAARLSLPDAFLFYPAQTWPHKNHERLFEALSLLRDRRLEIELVCSGTQTERYAGLLEVAAALGIGDRVRFLGFLTAPEVVVLYRRATGLVFPSLYEGWGLPILEAFAAGLPVATSDATSLPALVGEAALVFDPTDPVAIANAIERLWTDPDTRELLIARGRDRVAQFDWDATARLVRAVYRDIAGRPLDAADRALLASPPLV